MGRWWRHEHGSRRACCGMVLLALAAAAVGCKGNGGPITVSASSSRPVVNGSPASPSQTTGTVARAVPRPPIVRKPIPFPESRKQQMLGYAQRHYGLNTFRLVRPQVIVEHFTASTSFEPVFNTFSANGPDLGELPGTCSHFVVDSDGTIYQLVSLDLMCRHTVGLNYTAIGIEMVGRSDQDILGNPQQLASALDLTLWLMQRFHIPLRNVIGHNESLTSLLHRERVASFRCQTHQDWTRADMDVFRRKLKRLAAGFAVSMGPPATPVDSGC